MTSQNLTFWDGTASVNSYDKFVQGAGLVAEIANSWQQGGLVVPGYVPILELEYERILRQQEADTARNSLLLGLGAGLVGGLAGAGSAIVLGLAGAGGAVAGGLTAVVGAQSAGSVAQAGATATLGTMIVTALTVTLPTAIMTAMKSIVMGFVAGEVLRAFDLGGWILRGMLNPIIGGLERFAPTSPAIAEAGKDQITQLLSAAMNSLVGMVVTAESISSFKTLGLGYLSAMLYDAAGFRVIMGGIIEAYTKSAILVPLTYSTKAKFRPRVLDLDEAMGAYAQGKMSEADLSKHMAWDGLPDAYFNLIKQLATKPVRPSMLNALAQSGQFDRDFFNDELLHMRLSAAARANMLARYEKISQDAAYTGAYTALKSLYKEGFVTKNDVGAKLAGYAALTTTLDRQMLIAEWGYEYDYKNDMRSFYIDAFTNGTIDRNEATRSMQTIIVSLDRINALLDRAELKLKKTKAKTVISAAVS